MSRAVSTWLPLLCSLLAAHAAFAADGEFSSWTESVTAEGFVISLPAHDAKTLSRDLEILRVDLTARQDDLTQSIEASRPSAGRAILAAVMPGGLIYTGYKFARRKWAETNLLSVRQELTQLQRDKRALAGPERTLVAKVR